MPVAVCVRFSHAALQALSEDAGVDLLHIKGPAVAEELLGREPLGGPQAGPAITRAKPRRSVDADVLVRPSHLPLLFDGMRSHGWVTAYRFEDGSPFEHAATMTHVSLAPVDVHRRFPGVGLPAEVAFDRLWAERQASPIAGYPCMVPSVTAQRLVLLLHAARGGVGGHSDTDRCWTQATEKARSDVVALAKELHADVALAAASNRLDDFSHRREHDLWAALSRGETSMPTLWIARVRAEPNPRAAMRLAFRLIMPNSRRLEASLGRRPTKRELASAWVKRARWGAGEVRRLLAKRRGRTTR